MQTKTVLITGSSTGFGRAAVERFQASGWNVSATMRRPGQWDGPAPSDRLLPIALDVEDKSSIDSALCQTAERFGGIDCVVNNAGRGLFSVFETTPLQVVRALFETNVFGLMQVVQSAIPYLKEKRGSLINVSSSSGMVPEPFLSVYSASKHAVEGFTEGVAYELACQGISLKLVEPGLVQSTNFIQTTIGVSKDIPVPPAYESFVAQVTAMYMMQRDPNDLATEDDVANAIFEAAMSESSQLRYVVGPDTQRSAHMRRETSEEEYRAWALNAYGAKAGS